jgi:hypothetical protein
MTKGAVTINDGLGAFYYYDPLSTDADNGLSIIRPSSNPVSGRWKELLDMGTINTHELLSAVHSDTTPASADRGAIITGQDVDQGIVKWKKLGVGSNRDVLSTNGTDVFWLKAPGSSNFRWLSDYSDNLQDYVRDYGTEHCLLGIDLSFSTPVTDLLTIPDNINICEFLPGSIITIPDDDAFLIINNFTFRGSYQIFDVSKGGGVSLVNTYIFNPLWFSNNRDGVAIEYACIAANYISNNGKVLLSGGPYIINDLHNFLNIPIDSSPKSYIIIYEGCKPINFNPVDHPWQLIDCYLADTPLIDCEYSRPEWFGALGDGIYSDNITGTDDTKSIQCAINSQRAGRYVFFDGGKKYLSKTLIGKEGVGLFSSRSFEIDGPDDQYNSVLIYIGLSGENFITLENGGIGGLLGIEIKDIIIDGGGIAENIIYLETVRSIIKNSTIRNANKVLHGDSCGVYFGGETNYSGENRVENCLIQGCNYCVGNIASEHSSDGFILNNFFGRSEYGVHLLSGNGWLIRGNHPYSCDHAHIYVRGYGFTIHHNYIDAPTNKGIEIVNTNVIATAIINDNVIVIIDNNVTGIEITTQANAGKIPVLNNMVYGLPGKTGCFGIKTLNGGGIFYGDILDNNIYGCFSTVDGATNPAYSFADGWSTNWRMQEYDGLKTSVTSFRGKDFGVYTLNSDPEGALICGVGSICIKNIAGASRRQLYQKDTSLVDSPTIIGDASGQLSNLIMVGSLATNTDNTWTYWNLSNVAGTLTLSIYKDPSKTQLVAEGTRIGNGIITAIEQNGSGLSLTATVAYTVDDIDSGNHFISTGSSWGWHPLIPQSHYLTVSNDYAQKVSLGNQSLMPAFDLNSQLSIYSESVLGGTSGDNILMAPSTGGVEGSGGTNKIFKREWLLRDADGTTWGSVKWHTGYGLGAVYNVPGSTTKMWQEVKIFTGSENISWGNDAVAWLKLNIDRLEALIGDIKITTAGKGLIFSDNTLGKILGFDGTRGVPKTAAELGLKHEYYLSDYASLTAFIAAFPSAQVSLVIDKNDTITGTIPVNIDICDFINNAQLTGSGSITINKLSYCGDNHIFGNSLIVSLPNNNYSKPEWFGAVGDMLTNDTTAVQLTINSLGSFASPPHTKKYVVGSKIYLISGGIHIETPKVCMKGGTYFGGKLTIGYDPGSGKPTEMFVDIECIFENYTIVVDGSAVCSGGTTQIGSPTISGLDNTDYIGTYLGGDTRAIIYDIPCTWGLNVSNDGFPVGSKVIGKTATSLTFDNNSIVGQEGTVTVTKENLSTHRVPAYRDSVAILIIKSSHVDIKGCKFNGFGTCVLFDTVSSTTHEFQQNQRCKINDNVATECDYFIRSQLTSEDSVYPCADLDVMGNQAWKLRVGAIDLFVQDGLNCRNNIFCSYGGYIQDPFSGPMIKVQWGMQLQIDQNQIFEPGEEGIYIKIGVIGTIANNNIIGAGRRIASSGIRIYSTAEYVQSRFILIGNIISATSKRAIWFEGVVENSSIKSNRTHQTGIEAAYFYGDPSERDGYGIVVAAGCAWKDISVTNNDLGIDQLWTPSGVFCNGNTYSSETYIPQVDHGHNQKQETSATSISVAYFTLIGLLYPIAKTITELTGGTYGQVVFLYNYSENNIVTIQHGSILLADEYNFVIPKNQGIWFRYDSAGWRETGRTHTNWTKIGVGNARLASYDPSSIYASMAAYTSTPKFERTSSGTNSSLSGLRLKHKTTANTDDNFGAALAFCIESSAAVENDLGYINIIRNGADNSGKLLVQLQLSGATKNVLSVDGAGLLENLLGDVKITTAGKGLIFSDNTSGKYLIGDGNRYVPGVLTVSGAQLGNLGTEGTIPKFAAIGFSNTIISEVSGAISVNSLATTYKQSLLSVDQMQLSQLEGGAYFGRVRITENQLSLSDYGNTWNSVATQLDWYMIAMSSNGKTQTAIINSAGYIWVSYDYGATWAQKASSKNWYGIAMSADGKIQTAVIFGGYIWVSYDYGATWAQVASSKNWNYIAMSSDGKIQTAVIFGEYIWVSYDYGATWAQVASSLTWYSIAMSSDGKIQTAAVSGGYIWVSSDYGATWAQKGSSLTWCGVAMSSDGKIQTAVAYSGYIWVSYDYGATWAQKATSLGWYGIAMSSDGKIQTATVTNGYVWVSADYGATWAQKASFLTWRGVAMSSDGKIQTAVVIGGYIWVSYATSNLLGNLKIGSSGLGIVHSSAAGLLSSSAIVAADITNNTITNTQLANLGTAGKIPKNAAYGLADSIMLEGTNGIGIGAAVPLTLLEIRKAITDGGGITNLLTISAERTSNAGLDGPGILFRVPYWDGANTTAIGASIGAIRENSTDADSSTALVFKVSQNDETLDDAVRVHSNGNVENLLGDYEITTAGKGLIFSTVTAANGIRSNGTNYVPMVPQAVYAAGTAYTLTNTAALVDFGTTDPTLTLGLTMPYKLRASVKIDYVGATFAANQVITLKLRKTSGTPADIANSTITLTTEILTTITKTMGVFQLPEVTFAATAADVVQIWASVDTVPSAGSLQITAASLIAD